MLSNVSFRPLSIGLGPVFFIIYNCGFLKEFPFELLKDFPFASHNISASIFDPYHRTSARSSVLQSVIPSFRSVRPSFYQHLQYLSLTVAGLFLSVALIIFITPTLFLVALQILTQPSIQL